MAGQENKNKENPANEGREGCRTPEKKQSPEKEESPPEWKAVCSDSTPKETFNRDQRIKSYNRHKMLQGEAPTRHKNGKKKKK